MAKKSELTLEELTARKIRRSNGWTRFWAIVLALVLVSGVAYFANNQAKKANEAAEAEASSLAAEYANSNAGGQSWSDGSASGDSGSADANAPASSEAEAAVKAINAATAQAANAGYTWARKCELTRAIDVGSATETLNGIIHRVDSNADLNSVVGGFIGRGDKNATYTAGADAKETFGNANYALKATQLQASDLQELKVDGNTYTFKLANADNPQKDGGTPLNRLTDDFITQQEVADGIKEALGFLSSLLSVKSSDVSFSEIEVTVVLTDDGKLESLHYYYVMDVKKLELSVATGTGAGYVDATYNNFVY